MTTADATAGAGTEPVPDRIYRHSGLTRATHWINALSLFVLLLSGLNIFMAEPGLFLGQYADFDHPAVHIFAAHGPGGQLIGITQIGDAQINTTGFLGVSNNAMGHPVARTWPTWMTLPSYRDLATARRWHFFFAWMLVINGALYLAWNTYVRHIQKDLWPTREDIRDIPQSVVDHALLRHPTGLAATRYNVLQKLAYLAVILVLVPGMVLTGLTMSPGMDAALPVLPWAFGGRQTARTLHFLFAWGLVLFFLVHMVEMVLAGPVNELTSIVTGWYRVPKPHSEKGAV
jgi:thiosulfate reductase cytochrome b subunit